MEPSYLLCVNAGNEGWLFILTCRTG